MSASSVAGCPLCIPTGSRPLWQDAQLRIVSAGDPDYPGTLRVIWHTHVREMTDLDPAARAHCLAAVFAVEETLRRVLQPDKLNLASLGNQVPHLHWHVIPRFADDAHFPDAIWAARRRTGVARPVDLDRCRQELRQLLGPGQPGPSMLSVAPSS